MNKLLKRKKIAQVRQELELSTAQSGFVKNIGTTFFTLKQNSCVLRDFVYNKVLKLGIDFEVLALDSQYFVGTKDHASKLLDAYGGRMYPAECNYYAENAKALYVWELPYLSAKKNGILYNPHPMDYEEVIDIIFS